MERATGFEPATSTLARWRATNCAKPATQGDMLRERPRDCKTFFDGAFFSPRTSRAPPGGRPHFSAAAGRPPALLGSRHQVRAAAHSMRALGASGREGPRTRRAKTARLPALDAHTRCPHFSPALDRRATTKRRPEGRPSSPGGEARIRTGGQGFAGPCLTTWPLRRMKKAERAGLELAWSGLRGSNPRPPPWQGGALPTALSPQVRGI